MSTHHYVEIEKFNGKPLPRSMSHTGRRIFDFNWLDEEEVLKVLSHVKTLEDLDDLQNFAESGALIDEEYDNSEYFQHYADRIWVATHHAKSGWKLEDL